ncbi:MAG: Lrp/AsnC family transcriptional regulator [Lentisphaerae bacterium]|nr:Lrp/AsnC family transcriptional regulator [Lentisphaerota bacterium]MCP4100422.1 Lrp/AsnC family transcriptional regulator [Lentisphaerota bacterium]
MVKKNILNLLRENARISAKEIGARVGVDEAKVEGIIKELEQSNIIKGYKAILNEGALDDNSTRALIEVKVTPQRDGGFDRAAKRICRFPEVTDCYLVSGDYDLRLEVTGSSLQEIASFVSGKLATIDGVISTATVFLLKKYKESGKILDDEEEYERLKVSP